MFEKIKRFSIYFSAGRKHIDRGLFVASTEYAKDWFGYFRALKQRNSALKLGDISQALAYADALVLNG